MDWVSWFIEKTTNTLFLPFKSWENFDAAITGAVTAITDLNSKTGWLYLLTSLLVAAVIYLIGKRRGFLTASSLFKFVFPRDVYLHRSAIVDYKFVLIDLTIKSVLYSPLVNGIGYLTYKIVNGAIWQLSTLGLAPGALLTGTIAVPIIAMVLADFGFFLSHYIMHRVPVLWYFHEVHHSAEVLTPVTVYRTHPVEDLINSVAAGIISGAGLAAVASATGTELSLPMIFGVNVVNFFFFSIAFQLRHSHIWLSYGPVMSHIFISPAQHQIHHSTAKEHWDKNFGFVFAFWDAMFGTLYVPEKRETLQFGVWGGDPVDFDSVSKLYFLPFVKALRRIRTVRAKRKKARQVKQPLVQNEGPSQS